MAVMNDACGSTMAVIIDTRGSNLAVIEYSSITQAQAAKAFLYESPMGSLLVPVGSRVSDLFQSCFKVPSVPVLVLGVLSVPVQVQSVPSVSVQFKVSQPIPN